MSKVFRITLSPKAQGGLNALITFFEADERGKLTDLASPQCATSFSRARGADLDGVTDHSSGFSRYHPLNEWCQGGTGMVFFWGEGHQNEAFQALADKAWRLGRDSVRGGGDR